LLEHLAGDELDAAESVRQSLDAYRRTLEDDRRALLERYSLVDSARKAVGVPSLGTRCYIVLLQGRPSGIRSSCRLRKPDARCSSLISVRAATGTMRTGSSLDSV
jgi:uncharacterized protein (DUF2252 family)